MFDPRCFARAAAVVALSAFSAHAGDLDYRPYVAPERAPGFLADALYPDAPRGWADPAPAGRGVAGAGVLAFAAGQPEPTLPFSPHFGLSTHGAGGAAFVDGVFFSPVDGIELFARTGVTRGVQGMVGLTFRF